VSAKPADTRPVAVLAGLRGFGIVQSRLPLIERLVAAGWTVVVFANRDESTSRLLGRPHVETVDAGFGRRFLAPIADLRAMAGLIALVRSRKPRLVHFFNAKPTLLGIPAVRMSGTNPVIVNTITGLGHTYTMSRMVRALTSAMYRRVLPHSRCTFFQNAEHMRMFVSSAWVKPDRAVLVAGSGVDTDRYRPRERTPKERMTVLMASRLLRSKGVCEYLEAAHRVRAGRPFVQFLLAGELEAGHADGMTESEVLQLTRRAGVEFLGYRKDLDSLLPLMDVVVLPSYCHEGLPRVLLEAAACGVATITTDWPGCRDVVEPGVTGVLVPPRDARALAEALESLAAQRGRCMAMGVKARERALEQFDIRTVTERHLETYRRLLAETAP